MREHQCSSQVLRIAPKACDPRFLPVAAEVSNIRHVRATGVWSADCVPLLANSSSGREEARFPVLEAASVALCSPLPAVPLRPAPLRLHLGKGLLAESDGVVYIALKSRLKAGVDPEAWFVSPRSPCSRSPFSAGRRRRPWQARPDHRIHTTRARERFSPNSRRVLS